MKDVEMTGDWLSGAGCHDQESVSFSLSLLGV